MSQRKLFEKDGVFPPGIIDNVVKKLRSYNDKGLSERLFNKNEEIGDLVRQYLHCS
jgi:glutamine synthetase